MLLATIDFLKKHNEAAKNPAGTNSEQNTHRFVIFKDLIFVAYICTLVAQLSMSIVYLLTKNNPANMWFFYVIRFDFVPKTFIFNCKR